ncbi:Transmembrane protease serine [Dirofilaria immitis]
MTVQQQQLQRQHFSDRCSDLQNPDFLFDSEAIHHRFDETISSRHKIELIIWLGLLFAMVGIVIVIIILTIIKMQAISSTSFHASHYLKGHFLVTEGPLLKFDGRLLRKNTDEFITFANKIQRQLNLIYRQSNYKQIYIDSEVTMFRFVPSIPALEVTYILKIRSDLNIDSSNFLSQLKNYVRAPISYEYLITSGKSIQSSESH